MSFLLWHRDGDVGIASTRRVFSAAEVPLFKDANHLCERLQALHSEMAARVDAACEEARQSGYATGFQEGARAADEQHAAHLASPPPGAAQGTSFDSTIAHTPAASPPPLPRVEPPVFSVNPRWVIQVDGVGSFLVLSEEQVTIGPDRSSAHPDVALMADPAAPPVPA